MMIGSAIKFVLGNWQVALGVLALLACTHTYVYWDGRGDGVAKQLAKQDRAIVEAVMKAVKAEREAQAKFTEREQEREITTRDLREAAAKAPVGSKTKAVLDALRNR